MAPKKSTNSRSSAKTATSSGSSTSTSARRSSRKSQAQANPDDDGQEADVNGNGNGNGGKGIAPRHSRAPLPASTGSIQRPSTEARFEDLYPDSEEQNVAPPPPPPATSEPSSSKRKTQTSSTTSVEGATATATAKRKRTDSSAAADDRTKTGRASTSRSKAQSSRAPRATLNEEVVDDFVFTRVEQPVASTSRAETSTKRNGASSSRRSQNVAVSTSTAAGAASASTSRPLLMDEVEGETPIIRRNQAFRSDAPATPAQQRRKEPKETKDENSRSRKGKRPEGSSLRQTLGLGQPSGPEAGGSSSSSRRSSLNTKSSRRRSSLRDGRTPAYPHRDVPASELYRHVNAHMGPVPRLKAIFGWILERGVEDGSKGTLEPTTVPELPDPIPIPPPSQQQPAEDKKGKRKGKVNTANLGPARPPPQPVLNDADRAELAATASPAVLFRTVLSAILSKTVAELGSPASSIANLNWITRPQPSSSSSGPLSSQQQQKVPHPRNLAHAAMIARLEGTYAGLQSELKMWEERSASVERMERENEELEGRLEVLRSVKEEGEGDEVNGVDVVEKEEEGEGDGKGKGVEKTGTTSTESLPLGQEEAWVLSEADEARREEYLFALSVLQGQRGDDDDQEGGHLADEEEDGGEEEEEGRTPRRRSSKGRASASGGPSPSAKRKGKRKREEGGDAEGALELGNGGDVKLDLRNAIADAEWKIDQLRSSTHTLAQLDTISGRYIQAISLRLGDALKEITSDAPGTGLVPTANADTSGSNVGGGGEDLGALLRGVRTTSAAAAVGGTLEDVEQPPSGAGGQEDPGLDLLRSFVSASGGGVRSVPGGGRRGSVVAAAAPPTPRKSMSTGTGSGSEAVASSSSRPSSSRRSTNVGTGATPRPSSSAAVGAGGDKSVGGNVTQPTLAPSSPRPSRLPRPASAAPASPSLASVPRHAPSSNPGTPTRTPVRGGGASTPTRSTPVAPASPSRRAGTGTKPAAARKSRS
ncbi:unnamed protein product [Tilletia controversa]|nr:unnamed protein product [Tilletia controversa]